MTDLPQNARFRMGPWLVDPSSGELTSGDTTATLEPKLMDLLVLLVSEAGQVLSRERIESALWPDVVVGEDTVARTVSRLRRALNDSAQSPRFVETLPKRGYRLIESVVPVESSPTAALPLRTVGWAAVAVCVLALMIGWSLHKPNRVIELPGSAQVNLLDDQVARADDMYMRFSRQDNEAAIGLYERVLAQQPDHPGARAGLANALVQRIVRWPRGAQVQGVTTLTEALDTGLTSRPDAQAVLTRAVAMAERAVQIAPRDADALKALAFTYTAQGNLDRASEIYRDVIALDRDAWAAMINLGEIHLMQDDKPTALNQFEQAWEAMTRAYGYEPQRVGRWQVPFGILIGDMHEQQGHPTDAELWYRRVLALVPYQPDATVRLAALLTAMGERDEARSLCRSLRTRAGDNVACEAGVAEAP